MLEKEGIAYELNILGRKLTPEETVAALRDKTGVIAGTEQYPAKVLEELKNLRVISRCGAGIDGIDLEYVKKRNIALYRTENVHIRAVVELTLGAILALTRKLIPHDTSIKKGLWTRQMGRDISGCVAGIIGLGRVGMEVARSLHKLGCKKILAFDPFASDSAAEFVNRVDSLHDLARQSDIISIHAALNQSTRGLLNADFFKVLKPDVMIINTARGELINETDLYRFLHSHPQASAFLDVYAREPYQGELLHLPNIVATPHIGTFTRETRINMEIEAVTNLINFFKRHYV